jgi:AcrR family transcriptional regulator
MADNAPESALKTAHSRAPKQRRSQQSYDRMIKAAAALLEEGGIAALTLAAVSRRSRVSIGSIYCRVESKEALIREVQAVVLQNMEKEFALLLSRVRRKLLPLPELVPTVVRELAQYAAVDRADRYARTGTIPASARGAAGGLHATGGP